MRSALVVLLSLCAPLCLAQVPSPSPSKTAAAPVAAASQETKYGGEAVVIERSDTVIRYNADGTGERTLDLRIRVQNEAGARQFSVISLPYAAATDQMKIESVVVHHADGTTTGTPATDEIDMPAPVTQQAPLSIPGCGGYPAYVCHQRGRASVDPLAALPGGVCAADLSLNFDADLGR